MNERVYRIWQGVPPIPTKLRYLCVSCSDAVEKILAPGRLTVLPILDLDPGRRVGRVPGACLFRDNPLHVAVANHLEQFRAAGHVIHIQNRLQRVEEG